MHSLRQRLNVREESGFTLIELLVVLIIIGVLLAIAIPSYLGFQKSAQQTAAASDVRQAIPDAEAYFADNNTYTGMDAPTLQSTYDSGLKVFAAGPPEVPGIVTVAASTAADGTTAVGQEYCISAEDNGNWSAVAGPGGTVATKATSDLCAGWTKGISTTSDPTKFP
ncbi:MAG TPA: prepilin-type N-terminal cleavage/methylation domain-containing protein [Gaiellaceae bacterium]|nr:prepilin-type N-terminal cleavage/methylation domain-containing protein [Gaiellaceae bacterium]